MPTLAPLPTTAATATAALTSSLTTPVDAAPGAVRDAIDPARLAAPAERALLALGAGDRIVLLPSPVRPISGAAAAFGTIWRLDGALAHELITAAAFAAFSAPGHVKVRWDLAVRPAAGDGALLTIRTRFEPTDRVARERLLDAWSLVGPLADALTRRAAAAVKAAAEDDEV